jgi:uncharacterized protein (TIGR02246 family)
MRSWLMSSITGIGLITSAISVSAQQVDQDARQQIEKMIAAYHDNWNNHNPAGIAGLYTKDGVLVTQSPKVVKTGQQEIEQQYQDTFKAGIAHDSATADQIWPVGNELISVGEYHLIDQSKSGPTKIDGHWTAVYVRDGGAWKIRLLTAVPDLPAAPPAR